VRSGLKFATARFLKLKFLFPHVLDDCLSHTIDLGGYDASIVIEGHFHQGEILDVNDKFYVNLPCFACDRSYFVVEYAVGKINFIKKRMKGH